MPETKTKRRTLSADEAADLVRLSAKRKARDAESASAERNLDAFADFLAECDANIARAGVTVPEKSEWQRRRDHCAGPQTDVEKAKRDVARSLRGQHDKDLAAAKAKFGASLVEEADGTWTVEA